MMLANFFQAGEKCYQGTAKGTAVCKEIADEIVHVQVFVARELCCKFTHSWRDVQFPGLQMGLANKK